MESEEKITLLERGLMQASICSYHRLGLPCLVFRSVGSDRRTDKIKVHSRPNSFPHNHNSNQSLESNMMSDNNPNTIDSNKNSNSNNHGTDYTLSLTLQSDLTPVRSLCYLSSDNDAHTGILLSGSQQALLSRYFLRYPDGGNRSVSVSMDAIQKGHSHAISVLLPGPNDNSDEKIFVSGCKDAIVRVFLGTTLLKELRGHTGNVSSLSWLPNSSNKSNSDMLLLSGSWDGTARIWDISSGECVQVLPEHENTTIVLGLNNGDIVTGSAGIAQNNSIVETKLRFWRKSTLNHTFECIKCVPYPTGPIRGLCPIPLESHAPPMIRNQMIIDQREDVILFATCSNDGTVKIWDYHNADCLFTFEHPGQPMVLSVMAGPDGSIVSTTEDGDLIIWSYENSIQPIQTIRHSSTVWCSTILSNGDIASACQDGSVRCFTKDMSRVCSESELKEFEESGMRANSGPSNEEIAKLPRWEMRQVVVGKSEGQVQMFQKDGGAKAIAAQWSQASGTWIEVGEVLSTRDTSNSGTIDGVSYTHVFPIEFEAAGGVQTLKIGYNDGDNPFVVAQAFIDKYELPQYHLQQIADYIVSRVGQTPVQLGSDVSLSQHSQVTFPLAKEYKNLPQKYCITFNTDLPHPEKVMDKIKTLNTEIEFPVGKLSPEDIETLASVLNTLANTSHYHSTKISSKELNVLCRVLQNWPCAQVFPIIDILKICALHPDAVSSARCDYWQLVIKTTLKKCNECQLDNGKGATVVPTLSMRLFANVLKHLGQTKEIRQLFIEIIQCMKSHISSTNKNTRLAIATLLLNMTSSFVNDNHIVGIEEIFDNIFDVLLLAVNSPSFTDSQVTMTRILLAVGTLAFVARSRGMYRKQKSELLAAVARISDNDVVNEVVDILTL